MRTIQLAVLAFVFVMLVFSPAEPPRAQDSFSEEPSIFITEGGELILGPENTLDLRTLLRANQGRIDVSRLADLMREGLQPGYVTGRVFATRRLKPGQSLLADENGFADAGPLPDIEITLSPRENQAVVFGPWRTTTSGVFVSQPVPPGAYRFCAGGDGWARTCRGLELRNGRTHLEPFAMRPEEARDRGTVFGRVQLTDGGFPIVDVPHANLLAAARVTAFAASGARLREAHVNTLGDYVLPALPAQARMRVVVTFEGDDRAIQIPPLTLNAGTWLRRDIELPNSRPVVGDPKARIAGGLERQTVPPGATVEVAIAVDDPDGDQPSVRWILDPASGSLSSDSDPQTEWTVPEAPGPYVLRAVVDDGRGGVRTRALRLIVAKGGLETFSGTVSATDNPAVANAEVTVNGVPTSTNAAGYFSIAVAPAERYVLNIRSPGHAFFSQIYGQPSRGGRFELVRATVQSFDPGRDIELTDRRRDEECRGAPSASLRWEEVDRRRLQPIRLGESDRSAADAGERGDDGGQALDPLRISGGRVVDLPDSMLPHRKQRRDCGPGATVRIPAGALVDADGNPPPGAVEVAISTYDIEAEMEMPGDYTIADPGETRPVGVMESYGAAFVEARDATRRYNVREGAAAELVIPVAMSQLAAGGPLPSQIPILHYDEERGVWNRTGEAQLDGTSYRTEVAHFSAINADLEKVQPACVHIRTQTDTGVLPDQFALEFTVPADPGTGAAATVRTGFIDASADDDHVIYNLPEDREILLVPYDQATNTPFGTFVVDSGAPHGDPNNPPDHARCSNTAELFIPDAPRQLPSGVEYLQGLGSFFAYDLDADPQTYADNLEAASVDYYEQVDPLADRRDTFGGFKAVWGFDGSEPNARYANSADLGFGRDMHCTSADIDGNGDAEVACYVSNYGFRQDDDQDNANWASQQLEERYVATVAMEHAPIEVPGSEASPVFSGGDVVKFFVYGRDPDPATDTDGDGISLDHDEGELLTDADLDGYGRRPIPQLCMVCHGGTLPTAVNQDSAGNPTPGPLPVFGSPAQVDLGARFLPFDLDSFTFPSAGPVTGTQEAAFKTLNTQFVSQTDLSGAIQELLDLYYAPGGTSPTQNRGFVVPGWSADPAQEGMYEHVVGRNCRICHVAHDGINRTFEEASQLAAAIATYYACTERSMPHSVRTYERFWTSLGPHQPGQLANYAASQGVSASSCTFPPNNGQSFEIPDP